MSFLSNLWTYICKTFSGIWPFSRSKEDKASAKRKELERIINSVDYEQIKIDLPFYKKPVPQDVDARIEYLGELMVDIEKREIAVQTLTEKIREQQVKLAAESRPFLERKVRDHFERCKDVVYKDIRNEYDVLGQVADQGKQIWEKMISFFSGKKEATPDDFLTRILKRHLSEEKTGAGVSAAGQATAVYIAKEWDEFTAGEWNLGLQESFKLGRVRVGLDDSLTVAGQGTVAALGGTVLIAMGWHTFAWASTSFFPPAMLVVAVGTIIYGIVNKDKAIRKLLETAGKVVDEASAETLDFLSKNARPKMEEDIKNCADALVAKGIQQVWENERFDGAVVESWKDRVEKVFREAKVKSTAADSYHHMEVALQRARETFCNDDLILAAKYYEFSFYHFLYWCSAVSGVPYDSRDRKDFQMDFIGALGKAGFDASLRRRMDDARKFRNICSKDSMVKIIRSPEKFKKDYRENLEALEKSIQEVKEMARG
jgi:hypothetical protein